MQDLLAHDMFRRFTVDNIRNVVSSNDKQRFTLVEHPTTGVLRICANQGHSFEVCKV